MGKCQLLPFMSIQNDIRLQSETTSQITLIGARWDQLHNVIPKALFRLKQPMEVVFKQLPSTLSLRRTEGKKGQEILVKGNSLSSYPPGAKIPQCLACGKEKKKTQRICSTCFDKVMKFQVRLHCPVCVKVFSLTSSRLAQRLSKNPEQICCSHQCAGKARVILIKKTCLQCSKLFQPTYRSAQCCSRTCANLLHSGRMSGEGQFTLLPRMRSGQLQKTSSNDFREGQFLLRGLWYQGEKTVVKQRYDAHKSLCSSHRPQQSNEYPAKFNHIVQAVPCSTSSDNGQSWAPVTISRITNFSNRKVKVYDLEVNHQSHNFIANGFNVLNCLIDDPIKSSADIYIKSRYQAYHARQLERSYFSHHVRGWTRNLPWYQI